MSSLYWIRAQAGLKLARTDRTSEDSTKCHGHLRYWLMYSLSRKTHVKYYPLANQALKSSRWHREYRISNDIRFQIVCLNMISPGHAHIVIIRGGWSELITEPWLVPLWEVIKCKVPQESILHRLLVLYDLSTVSNNCISILFAEDANKLVTREVRQAHVLI